MKRGGESDGGEKSREQFCFGLGVHYWSSGLVGGRVRDLLEAIELSTHRRTTLEAHGRGVAPMGQDEEIRAAQEVLDWVITHLSLSIKCKVIEYKRGNYRVQVFKGDRLIMPIQVTEEWVKGSNPKDDLIYETLKSLSKNLDNFQQILSVR